MNRLFWIMLYAVVLTAACQKLLEAAPPAAAPVPSFQFSPANPTKGSPVRFDGSASVCSPSPCTYRWTDDADGSTLGWGVTMSFTFQGAGTKYVRLRVTDAQGGSATIQRNVIVSQSAPAPVAPPTAAFTFSPAAPAPGSAVAFNGSGSSCAAAPCTYRWTDDADSSQLGTGATMSFTFQGAGTKYVRLTVTDAQSRSASVERDVVVSQPPPPVAAPVAAFTFSPSSPLTGAAVSFVGSGSTCAATPCTYRWTNDAGGATLGTGVTLSYTFPSAGTAYVRLTVTDAQNRSASVEHDVVVSQPPPPPVAPPVAAFAFSPSSPFTGSAVSFNGSASTCPASPCIYRWTNDAGGATLGTGVTLSYTFPSAGTAYVRLTVTDAQNRSASVEHDVVVVQATAPPFSAFSYSPSNPVAGSPVAFNGSTSTCAASPCTYQWTDDADGSAVGSGVTLSYTFLQAGARYIRLTLTDTQARTSSFATALTVAAAPPSTPGAFYVSTSGSDTNPGTSTSPWRTIQKAANTLNAGETAFVSAGTYSERVSMTRSGASGRPITLQAQGAVVMRGFNIQASYIKVSGFEITNTPGTSATDRSGGSGVYLSGANNEIAGNYIHHSTAAGIYMTSSSSSANVNGNRVAYGVECGIFINGNNHLIASNDISHTRSVSGSDADGIRFFGSGNTVRKNYIHDLMLSDSPGQSPHIDAFQTWGPATNYVFEQNLVDKTPSHDQGFTIEGMYLPVDNIVIRNNVMLTRGTGYQPDVNIGDLGTVSNVTIVNNTMAALNGPTEYAIWVFPSVRGAVIKNNAIHDHGNRGAPYIKVESGASTLDIGFNSVSKSDGIAPIGSPYAGDLWLFSPLFQGLSGGDLHLLPLSPLINRGANLSQVTNDYDGTARPNGMTTDIGAFEYVP